MSLDLLQRAVPGLRHKHDAEEKTQGGDRSVDPEHAVVTNKLYQVGVADRQKVTGFIVYWALGPVTSKVRQRQQKPWNQKKSQENTLNLLCVMKNLWS